MNLRQWFIQRTADGRRRPPGRVAAGLSAPDRPRWRRRPSLAQFASGGGAGRFASRVGQKAGELRQAFPGDAAQCLVVGGGPAALASGCRLLAGNAQRALLVRVVDIPDPGNDGSLTAQLGGRVAARPDIARELRALRPRAGGISPPRKAIGPVCGIDPPAARRSIQTRSWRRAPTSSTPTAVHWSRSRPSAPR